ncbi:MAG: aminoglycoside 6'-N-acetyltransferase [Pyrinomonadaceae bacterium]
MTGPQIVIRPLSEDDIEEWFRLRGQLWDNTSEHDHKSEMLDILEHGNSQLVLVADLGEGRLAGFLEASIRPFVEDCDSDHVGYLEGWFVAPEYRRRGIGRGLVAAAEEWARMNGCAEMASDAEIDNSVSIEAHLRLGYEETSRLVHLRKELD